MENRREIFEKLEELKTLKQEIKEKIKSLEELEKNLQNLAKDFFSQEVPETQKYTYKRMKVIELQVNNIEKIHDALKKYYDILKDLTEKEAKLLVELQKQGIDQENINITQEQFWLLLSKLGNEGE